MLGDIVKRVKQWNRRFSWSFGDDISTPAARRSSAWHVNLVDHGALRILWTNMGEVAPGVWRSNQPSPARIGLYAEMGIRAIIYLRGPVRRSYLLFEEEACARHGIKLYIMRLSARSLAPREDVLALLDLFEVVERPFLMHCKSGADRASLASALWLLHMEGASVARAKEEISFRYLHLRNSSAGVLGFMLDRYAENGGGMSIRDWIAERYEPEALTAEWRAKMAARKAQR